MQCRKEHQSKIFFALCNLLVSTYVLSELFDSVGTPL